MANKRSFGKTGDRRAEILEAAAKLFSTRGFHGTSMRDLAEAVNLQGGSLYAHIESKEELLFELVNDAADQFIGNAESIPKNLEAKDKLNRLVRGHLEVIVKASATATVFFHEWKQLNPPLQQQITQRRDSYEAIFRETIQSGTESGDFEISDVRTATIFILSALNATYQWYKPRGELNLEALSDRFVSLIFQTLGVRENKA